MILSVAILARAIWAQVDHSILDQAQESSGDCLPCMACRSHWPWQWPTMTSKGQQQAMAQSIGPRSATQNERSLIVFQGLRTQCLQNTMSSEQHVLRTSCIGNNMQTLCILTAWIPMRFHFHISRGASLHEIVKVYTMHTLAVESHPHGPSLCGITRHASPPLR